MSRPRDLGLWLSLGTLAAITLACFLGPALLPDDAGQQALSERLRPPFWSPDALAGSPLGTDAFGRDMLSRTLEGGRVSLEVGFGAATGAVLIGTLLGVLAGFWGGWLDKLVMALADVWLAFPFLVIQFFLMSFTVLLYNITQVTFRQRITPPRLLGRMNASVRFVVWGVMPIAALLAGALGTWIGVVPTLWIAAVGELLAGLFVITGPFWSMRELPEAHAEHTQAGEESR